MKTLTIEQMELSSCCGGNPWKKAAIVGCAVWGAGRIYFSIGISAAASPLAAAICNGIIDYGCAALGLYEAGKLILGE